MTALVLLLLAATDVFVIDALAAFRCDQNEESGSGQSGSSDECFCCCAHVVMPQIIHPPSMPTPVLADPAPSVTRQSAASIPTHLPPRS